MKSILRQSIAFASVIALFGTTVVPLCGSENAEAFGEFDPSTILNSPAPELGEQLAFDMNRVVMQQTRLIRYQATEYQRKVAEQRARAFVAAQRKAIAKAKAATPSKPTVKTPEKPSKPTPGQPPKTAKKTEPPSKPPTPEKPAKPEKKVAESAVVEKPKELPRYIAVDTVKDKRASPKAKKVVMIWDTQSESLVGNNVYDVENPPPVGAKTKFETYSVEYIGAGL